jgi:hypothetical protein
MDMKCEKVENYVVKAGIDRPDPSWGILQVAVKPVVDDRLCGHGTCAAGRGGG